MLLLGDGSYDYKDYLGTGVSNLVPPLIVKTSYLWTASDPAYVSVHGDDVLPDLAIGRLPAKTVEDLRAMVRKIVAYETAPVRAPAPIVLVADDADEAGSFETSAEAVRRQLLAERDVETIYLGALGPDETHRRILSAFDAGASLMSYTGHGGIHLWADENIFNTADVSSLAPQPQMPILLTMNCLNGYFHFPYFDALAETLLKAEDKGVIAAFSPSGLSLTAPAERYHEALLAALVRGGHRRLGDAVMDAQSAYAATGALPELLSIYHLFGDPALLLH